MTTYRSEWEGAIEQLPTSSLLFRRLSELWADDLTAESEYFLVLGHLARNGLGPVAAKNAIRIATRRLDNGGGDNVHAAIDLEVVRCMEALATLASAPTSFQELVRGRESVEGLRSLLRSVLFGSTGPAEEINALLEFADAGASQVDAAFERVGFRRRPGYASISSELAYLLPLVQLHRDDWWNALVHLDAMTHPLAEAANKFDDDFQVLESWLLGWRGTLWGEPSNVRRFCEEVIAHIDASYSLPRKDARALRVVSTIGKTLLDQLAKPTTRGAQMRWLARGVTLAWTLYERILGLVGPAVRVPSELGRLGWAACAWRRARLLQYPEGETVVHAFQRHFGWPHSTKCEESEAVAAGCSAAAWYTAQTGYRAEAKGWLARAESLTIQGEATGYSQRVVEIATAWTELATLFLQPPEQAEMSVILASHALTLADQCSATLSQSDHCIAARVRAMSIRATAWDRLGEFVKALEDRSQAIAVLERNTPSFSPSIVVEMRRELYLACGDVESADRVMLEFMRSANPRARAAAAYTRATMLREQGYEEAGFLALQELAASGHSDPWISRARAQLASTHLETEAQLSLQVARGLSSTGDARNHVDEALAVNQRCLDEDADDLIALTRKAQLLIQRGSERDLTDAEHILSKLPTDDAYVLFCYGRLAFKRGDFVDAASWLRAAYELAPRAHTAVLLAQSLLHSKQLHAALEVVDAQDSVEDDAPLLDIKGSIHTRMGNFEEAWRSYTQACAALGSQQAFRFSGSSEVPPPHRKKLLCQRMAVVAARVAQSEPAAVEHFLRSDAEAASIFITSCITRLAFQAPLRDVILRAGALPTLKRAIAKYAMGACVYEDTFGNRDAVPAILEQAWRTLELHRDHTLVAELLAGGKSSYIPAIRSAMEGPSAATRERARQWLATPTSQWSELTRHVATTFTSETYYRDTGRLVATQPALWKSPDALIQHVQQQIPAVRLTNLVHKKIAPLIYRADHSRGSDYEDVLVETARMLGRDAALFDTEELKLNALPSYLVTVTPWTVRLAVRVVGTPTNYDVFASDETALALRVIFDGATWPTSLRELLAAEGLMPADGKRSIVLPIEAAMTRQSRRD